MKKIIIGLFCLVLVTGAITNAAQKDLEIQGRNLVSQKPPFTLTVPSEFNLVHSFSHENPGENSLTRVYFLVKTKGKQVEEMLLLQIADKTNPQAGPVTIPPLKPYVEERMYRRDKVTKGELVVNYLIQLMAWNPDAKSLEPIVKKGMTIPNHWALQGQFQFIYLGEHGVFVRYSNDVNSFGVKVSEEGKDWNRDGLSGNEKRVYEIFQKRFMEVVNSVTLKNP
jgi:hypothetical protein